jgi:hypothetical protein
MLTAGNGASPSASGDSLRSLPAFPAVSTLRNSADMDADTASFGDVPGIAIPQKPSAPLGEATQHTPVLSQTVEPFPEPTPEPTQESWPGTFVLYVHVDEIAAIDATIGLAGTPPADLLDLQVRAFGLHRDSQNAADLKVPSWMNVTRMSSHFTPQAVQLAMAFAAGRDSSSLDQERSGRVTIVTGNSEFEALNTPGSVDIVPPSYLLQHLHNMAASRTLSG